MEGHAKETINFMQTLYAAVAAVLEIVKVVAVDPLITKVSRMINAVNHVNSCRCQKGVDISVSTSFPPGRQNKLYGSSNFTEDCMERGCKRGGALEHVLKKQLRRPVDHCTSCVVNTTLVRYYSTG